MTSFAASAERLAAAAREVAPYYAPIFKAAQSGCNVIFCGQSAGRFDLPRGRPLLALIGDDTTRALGPPGFHGKSLKRLVRSAGSGLIISGAPYLHLYALAATAASISSSAVVIVETRIEEELAWIELFQRTAPGCPLIVSTVEGGTA